MRHCSNLEYYLTRFLKGEALVQFEEHLNTCAACSQAVNSAKDIDQLFKQMIKQRPSPLPSDGQKRRIINSANARIKTMEKNRPYGILIASAAAVLLLGVSAALFFSQRPISNDMITLDSLPETSSKPEVSVLLNEGGHITSSLFYEGQILSVPHKGHLIAEADGIRLGIDEFTQIETEFENHYFTKVHLDHGAVAFDVATRTLGTTFSVRIGDIRVNVLGTQFYVSNLESDTVTVGVLEGKVHVFDNTGKVYNIKAGEFRIFSKDSNSPSQQITDDTYEWARYLLGIKNEEKPLQKQMTTPTASPSETTPTPPKRFAVEKQREKQVPFDYNAVRQMILDGQIPRAVAILDGRLKKVPGDYRAWRLLAQARQRARDWQGAIMAYQQVVSYAEPRSANRARFSAAVLMQDKLGQHLMAEGLINAYLAQPKSFTPLVAEAEFRLAKSALATNQREKGLTLLEKVASTHRGTAAAVQARKLLAKYKEEQ